MKDGRPDQSIKFELRIKGRYPIDIEMVVKILSNGEEVIVQLLNLLVFPQDCDFIHLFDDELVKRIVQLLSKLVSKLVIGKVS